MTEMVDQQVDASEVAAGQRSPRALLDELIDEHSAAMYRVARSIVHDSSLAEDVVQESLVKAWQAAATFRGEASLRSWALRITHNTAISMLRKRREDVRAPETLPEADHGHSTDRQVTGKFMIDELWVALDRLDELSRTIVVLRELEGMTYEDIADALAVPLPTVKTRLFRARKSLANALSEWR